MLLHSTDDAQPQNQTKPSWDLTQVTFKPSNPSYFLPLNSHPLKGKKHQA